MRIRPRPYSSNGFVRERMDETGADRKLSRPLRTGFRRRERRQLARPRRFDHAACRVRRKRSLERSADFERAARAIGAVRPQIEEQARRQRPSIARRPAARANAANSLVAREAAKAEEMATRLAEAYARGRDDGRAEASAEAEKLRAADRARSTGTGRCRTGRVPSSTNTPGSKRPSAPALVRSARR